MQIVSLRETAAKKAATISGNRCRDAACHVSTFLFQSCKIAFFVKSTRVAEETDEKAMRC
jgi:hypothetical protein